MTPVVQVLSLRCSFLFFSSAGEEGHAPRSSRGSLLRHWKFALRKSLHICATFTKKPVHWETVENLPFVAGPFHKIEKIQNTDTLFGIQFSTRPFA